MVIYSSLIFIVHILLIFFIDISLNILNFSLSITSLGELGNNMMMSVCSILIVQDGRLARDGARRKIAREGRGRWLDLILVGYARAKLLTTCALESKD
jgi:hypothetical protein